VSLAGVGPLLWWGTGVVIPLLFAQDTPSLAAFLAAPPPVGSVTEALALLSSALSLASRSRQVCLCLCLDGQRVYMPVSTAHTHLLHRAHAFWGEEWSGEQSFFLLPEAVRLRLHTHGWLSLQQWQASPSLFTASRLLRVFSWGSVVEQEDILALPVSVPSSDHLLGVLLLGPAEDRLPYAGADLERVIQVTDVAAPCLAQIQQREDDQRQDRLPHQLSHGLALLPRRWRK